jgi:two-component system OmpR family sensor kinase
VLRNAVRYTAAGSSVDVATALVARSGGTQAPADAWRLKVSDRGPGVTGAELESIFEPFFRGSDSSGNGHGLGLAIAKRVIETHGGSIVATERPGGGLIVEIVLPIRP